MKTLTFKLFGCAAALALLTVAQAQNQDNGNGQMPANQIPENSVPQSGATTGSGEMAPGQNEGQPNGIQNGSQPQNGGNVVLVPVPVPVPVDTNNPDMNGSMPAAGEVMAPDESQQPVQQQPPQNFQNFNQNNNYNQNQGRGGYNRDFRRNRDFSQRRQNNQFNNNSNGGDASAYQPPANASTNGTDELYLNFHGAPIDEVLNYLSDAAGFIIELDTRVSGTVDVWSAHPVSREEAVELLNSVLNKNGYAAVREGRVLRVMSYDTAIHSEIPVKIGADPNAIPSNDEIVTQIIPIRFVEARQLITDLSPLTSSHATIIANDAGNSIIVTDTQANIRHLVEIVQAIDSSAEDVTEVRVFHLQYHDPTEVANLLTQVFADQNGQNGQATPIRFGGFGGGAAFRRFFGGGRGGGGRGGFPGFGGGQQGGNNQNDRIRNKPHVVAVADERTGSVLVTAPKDLMTEIEQLIGQMDQESPKVPHVTVVHLENSDPQQVEKVLQEFQANNGRSSQNSQNSPLIMRENQSSIYNSSTIGGGGGVGGGGFRGGGQ